MGEKVTLPSAGSVWVDGMGFRYVLRVTGGEPGAERVIWKRPDAHPYNSSALAWWEWSRRAFQVVGPAYGAGPTAFTWKDRAGNELHVRHVEREQQEASDDEG